MELEMIQTLIIAAAPAITSIIGIIAAMVTAIKKIKKVDGSLVHINAINAAIMKENAELKKELKKVYKLHSELVEHIAYHDKDNCPVCNKGD
jgi:hypothetical protein